MVLLEEGGFVASDHYRYAIESVIGPQLLRSGGREIHISSPSEDAEHHLHTGILPYCDDKDTLFQYTVYDSPSVTPEMIRKAIERCGGENTEAFQREYLARIVRSTSLMIVPEFDEARHVKEFEIPEHYTGLLSIDMGGVRDKTAASVCIWDFARAKMLITDGFCLPSNTPTSEVVTEARKLLANTNFHGDSKHNVIADVPGQVQVDMAESHNFQITAPAKDDRDAAINNFRLLFQQDKIEIHPRCSALIGCLKAGRYNDMRTDFLRSEKYGHADPIMAAVYGARMLDRTTNPFPGPLYNRDTQIRVAYRNKEENSLKKFAEELMPWNPQRQRK